MPAKLAARVRVFDTGNARKTDAAPAARAASGGPGGPGGSGGAVPDERVHHRRDEAIVRLMLETGIRPGEVAALETGDLDLANGRVHVCRGKGGTGRVVLIELAAIRPLGRYLSPRYRRRRAD